MKKIFVFVFVLLFIFGFGYGRQINDSDCATVEGEFEYFFYKEFDYLKIFFDVRIINRAYWNLKSYCNVLDGEETKSQYESEFFPQSKYLYDHLVDVIMRYNDGNSFEFYNLNGIEYFEGGLLESWLEDKKKISTEEQLPSIILDLYNKYWNLNSKNNDYQLQLNNWKDVKNCKLTNLIGLKEDFKKANMAQRYIESCGIAMCLYNSEEKSYILDKSLKKAFDSCLDIASNRIVQETRFLKTMSLRSLNNLNRKVFNKYLVDYNSSNKLMYLHELVFDISDLLTTVTNSVQEGTKNCN